MTARLYTVIALDPGVTTGYAIGVITSDGEMLVVTGQERWNSVGLFTFLNENKPDFVIYERFEFRQKNRPGVELFPRELIGVIKLWWQTTKGENEPGLYQQMPSVIGGYFSDKKLKEASIYKEGRPHSNDAARHLLQWFKFGSGFQYNKKGYVSAV